MSVRLPPCLPGSGVAAEKSLEEEIAAEIEAEAEEDDVGLTAVDEEEDHGHLLTAMPSPAALVDVAYVMPGRKDDDGTFRPGSAVAASVSCVASFYDKQTSAVGCDVVLFFVDAD